VESGSAPPVIPTCWHACCSPPGPCDVRGVMRSARPRHGSPRKRVPPCRPHSALPRSHKYPPAGSPRASTKSGSLSLASSGHLTPHGQAGGGSRLPTVPLRSTAARLAAHPSPQRAPRHGLRHRVLPASNIRFSFSCFFIVPIGSGGRHTMPPAPRRSPPRRVRKALRETLTCRRSRTLARATSGR
jgi:hypothetical protein